MATTATTTHTTWRSRFGEAGSLRSFRGNGGSSNPPSIKASSLKTKKSLALPSLLGSRGGATKAKDIKLKDLMGDDADFIVGEDGKIADERISHDNIPAELPEPITSKQDERSGKDANPLQRPRSKSRTIIRLISTKFRSRSPPPPSPSKPRTSGQGTRVPTAPANSAAKEARDAALRARGLLPPLPQADLSWQEMEQDRHIPVVAVANEEDAAAKELSAANLIKQEWEAKNKSSEPSDSSQRERLNNFKFGGPSTSPAPSPLEQEFAPTELTPVVEMDTPLPSPISPQQGAEVSSSSPVVTTEKSSSPLLQLSNRAPPPPALELNSRRFEHTPMEHDMLPPSRASSEDAINPFYVPLPPSPLPSLRDFTQALSAFENEVNPLMVPIPASPAPGTPRSIKMSLEISTTGEGPSSLPMASPPLISLSPPGSPVAVSIPQDGSTPSQPITPPQPLEHDASLTTPSLDYSVLTLTDSTLSTTESSFSANRGKGNGLTVKTHYDNNIPVIVESPVEEAPPNINEHDFSPAPGNTVQVATELVTIKEDERPLKRGHTDPTGSRNKNDRRKSINPFKRGQTGDSPDSVPAKRLTVSASLNNMRRSVVGSLSRPKSTMPSSPSSPSKTFDASHLPPSPTVPTSFAAGQRRPSFNSSPPPVSRLRAFSGSRQSTIGLNSQPRLAVAPTLHSRGSILIETNNIEDEETRRMTEMAFLG